MYIATDTDERRTLGPLGLMPISLRPYIVNLDITTAREVRLIVGKPLIIQYPEGDCFITPRGTVTKRASLGIKITQKHIDELLERASKSSLYSMSDSLCEGYITIEGGHRIGVAGTVVEQGGKRTFIKNISAMTIRLAREIPGVADGVIDRVMTDGVENTLIIAPPGCGKTTMLRDLIRHVSDGGYFVSVADERGEIAVTGEGESPFDLGCRTTVMANCPKSAAMTLLLRSMSPQVIATDELDMEKDSEAVCNTASCGVSVIATVHGRDLADIRQKQGGESLLRVFDIAVILSNAKGVGTVENVIRIGDYA